MTPDGRKLYVTAETDNNVTVIDVEAKKATRRFTVGKRPRWAAFTSDGARAYVSAEVGGVVSVIDVARDSVIATIALGDTKPVGVVLSHDDKWVYVAEGHAAQVVVIDATDRRPLLEVPWESEEGPESRALT